MNSLLNDINYNRLRSAEVLQLVSRLIEDYEASKLKLTDEELKRLINRVKQQLQAFQLVLEQAKVSDKVQEVNQLDNARDKAFRLLTESIKAYRYSEIAAEKKAYNALNALLKQYKDLLKRGYSEKSGLIIPLLAALKSTEYSDDVQALNVSKFVTALNEKQQAFNTLLVERSKEKLAKRAQTIKGARSTLLEEYHLLTNYIIIMNDVKASEQLKQLLAIVRNSRAPFVTNTLRRQTKYRNRDKSDKPRKTSKRKEETTLEHDKLPDTVAEAPSTNESEATTVVIPEEAEND
ncbi:DUF6261 family protein [Aerococcaceae bacterium NML180378]|nr:DUF6261 family protein [Aerococcaceae bacterium NML180378]